MAVSDMRADCPNVANTYQSWRVSAAVGVFSKVPTTFMGLMHFGISFWDVRRNQMWSSSTGMTEGLMRTETEKQCLVYASGRSGLFNGDTSSSALVSEALTAGV